MMRTSYDPEADAFYAQFAPEGTVVSETREVSPGVMMDLDALGNMIGFEVLGVISRGLDAYSKAASPVVPALAS